MELLLEFYLRLGAVAVAVLRGQSQQIALLAVVAVATTTDMFCYLQWVQPKQLQLVLVEQQGQLVQMGIWVEIVL